MLKEKIDEMKSEMTIAEVNKDDEITRMRQKFHEESASFQHILKESIEQARQNATMKFEEEKLEWIKNNDKIQQELKELKMKLSHEISEGPLSTIAKTFQKKITSAKKEEEPENLENSMKKAQEDVEMLKSVVTPLEDEINSLKKQLQEKTEQLDRYLSQSTTTTDASTPDACGGGGGGSDEESAKNEVVELKKNVHSERGSRTDLEMYVTVLNIQKDVLKADYDRIKEQLETVQKLLNMNVQRLESVLTDEQREMVEDLKAKDTNRIKVEQRVEHLRQLRIREELVHSSRNKQESMLNDLQLPPRSPIVTSTSKEHQQQQPRKHAYSSNHEDVFADDLNTVIPSQSSTPSSSSPSLQSSSGVNNGYDVIVVPNNDVTDDVAAHSKQQQQQHSHAGNHQNSSSRVVSDLEWQKLQIEESEKKLSGQVKTLIKHLDVERLSLNKQGGYIKELEDSLRTVVENSEMNTLRNKLHESENFLKSFKDNFERNKMELYDCLKNLVHDREQIQRELTRLQNENDSLLDKHTKKAQEMQEEFINFPNNLEEMHLLLLRYREDLITCKVTLEHNTEVLRSEISFLKSRLEAEQQERNNMEETLTQELNAHRQLSSELESERVKRKEEEKLKAVAEDLIVKNAKTIENLQFEVKQLTSVKAKNDKYIQELKGKIHSLQVDLDNSEDVQRDFVKLSQTLQIQLEKIRAAETEVRWQHEDDVIECSNCKVHFNGHNKKKIHCKHCGQIFCVECLSKTVNSGPNMRPNKVCDVCHTMLVKDATPYFSVEQSHTLS
ncbi:hypothetical protein HELRODRAFT_188699 [Helobdella robusta]|uniref:FYVE-type domain-containing protein n=1 Tax=Helobdella robusta TaxID=6412 RepID=T1FQ98_HELRO|nr:hypothetical protein HELRODRAFT_188699 [Helobdella robusta]ESO02424.1 hypothetical protein HELRODRAFT_188699 [Helobdella robusta]